MLEHAQRSRDTLAADRAKHQAMLEEGAARAVNDAARAAMAVKKAKAKALRGRSAAVHSPERADWSAGVSIDGVGARGTAASPSFSPTARQ